jgi:hypothetical protein
MRSAREQKNGAFLNPAVGMGAPQEQFAERFSLIEKYGRPLSYSDEDAVA